MVALIEWGSLQRATNAHNQSVVCRNFNIKSHDGYVSGQIVVDDTTDEAAAAVCESRLALLLMDALNELGR
jgi:hypothetical protein